MVPKPDLTVTESSPQKSGRPGLIKDWKSDTAGNLNTKWRGPYQVILCIPIAIKLEGHSSWAQTLEESLCLLHRKPVN